ncbi:MAG: hypothetical protein FWF57_09930 [Defluviitaleaceae bacterium]|nr:hypothetical protein [Defluviitaleaceae bacterium]
MKENRKDLLKLSVLYIIFTLILVYFVNTFLYTDIITAIFTSSIVVAGILLLALFGTLNTNSLIKDKNLKATAIYVTLISIPSISLLHEIVRDGLINFTFMSIIPIIFMTLTVYWMKKSQYLIQKEFALKKEK